MELRRVTADASVRALLAACGLPADDLDDPSIALVGAFDRETLAGVIGLQLVDGSGLLRSLAVAPAFRDRGLGGTLCDRILDEARARSLASLWLLTTTARDYFARRGFEAIRRDEVPAAIRATAQFSALCPASATVMQRRLSR